MILSDIETRINELLGFDPSNEKECMEAIKEHPHVLKYIKNQTLDMCLIAVRQNGLLLEYVKEQTFGICLEAVKQNGRSLQYVKSQTPKLCMEAVEQTPYALEYVKNQTPEICKMAIEKDENTILFVNDLSMIVDKNEIKYISTNNILVNSEFYTRYMDDIKKAVNSDYFSQFKNKYLSFIKGYVINALTISDLSKLIDVPELVCEEWAEELHANLKCDFYTRLTQRLEWNENQAKEEEDKRKDRLDVFLFSLLDDSDEKPYCLNRIK